MKIAYLCFVSRYGEVANCPGSLLLSLEFAPDVSQSVVNEDGFAWWTRMGFKSQLDEQRWFSRSQLTWTDGWWPWAQARFQSLLALAVGSLLLCWTRTTPPPASGIKLESSVWKEAVYLVDLLLAVVEKAWEVLQCSLKYSRIARHFILGLGLQTKCIWAKIETWFRTVCVWSSVPVTIFPTARNAAVWTFTLVGN